MYASQIPWAELYAALLAYEGGDAHAGVLAPWLASHADERAWLAGFAERTADDWTTANEEDLCRLYAISRITSVLLLHFQRGERDWAGPAISPDDFLRFHQALGFRVPDVAAFHPFYHEIVEVRQADDPQSPVEILEERWPPLMLGAMMFCRGGCVVSAGVAHVVREVAEGSRLYWAFRRRDRPCADLSHGWGGNSQWRTRLRRDYATPEAYHYNVDCKTSLNGVTGDVDGLPAAAMAELVRHRCFVRTPAGDADPFPYAFSYVETRQVP